MKKLVRGKSVRVTFSCVAVSMAILCMMVAMPSNAGAQTPNPSSYYEDTVMPSDPYPSGALAVIVSGLALEQGSCHTASTYSIANVVAAVNKFIKAGDLVYYEVSPQEHCADAATFESAINTVMNDIFADNSASALNADFEGVTLDEEDGWYFSYSTLEDINNDVISNMIYDGANKGVLGLNFFTEAYVYGQYEDNNTVCVAPDWTQAEYNDIVDEWDVGAPQISNPCMVQLANNSYNDYAVAFNLVTWEKADQSPFNQLSYA